MVKGIMDIDACSTEFSLHTFNDAVILSANVYYSSYTRLNKVTT